MSIRVTLNGETVTDFNTMPEAIRSINMFLDSMSMSDIVNEPIVISITPPTQPTPRTPAKTDA